MGVSAEHLKASKVFVGELIDGTLGDHGGVTIRALPGQGRRRSRITLIIGIHGLSDRSKQRLMNNEASISHTMRVWGRNKNLNIHLIFRRNR